MTTVLIELTSSPEGVDWPGPPAVAADGLVLVDDVEELSAFNRCSCSAGDDAPY